MQATKSDLERLFDGDPRSWMENNLFIVDEHARTIPLKFDTAQEYYHREIFGDGRHGVPGEGPPVDVLLLKDRKARWTTYTQGLAFSYALNVSGVLVISFFHDDTTAGIVGMMVDTFYDNLPPESVQPKGIRWDRHVKQIQHGSISSTIILSTAKRRDIGRSLTPHMLNLDEMGAYAETYEEALKAAIKNSLPPSSWVIRGSTVSRDDDQDEGAKGKWFRKVWEDIKDKKVQTKYLFVPWMMRPENRLGAGDLKALTDDVGDIELKDEEKALGLDEDQARWRRWQIHEAGSGSYGNEGYAKASFWKEHPEDDLKCWMPLGDPELQIDDIERLVNACRPPIEDSLLSGGIRARVWRRPMPGVKYVMGYDPALGRIGGDFLSSQIMEGRSGIHVAELHGLCPLSRFTEAVCEWGLKYNSALLGIEANGLGAAAIEIAVRMKYPRLYRRPPKRTAGGDFRLEPIGVWTDEESKTRMHHHAREGLIKGELITWCKEVVEDLIHWNPKKDKHPPDRFMAYMICQELERNSRGEMAMPVSSGERERLQPVMGGTARAGVGFWVG